MGPQKRSDGSERGRGTLRSAGYITAVAALAAACAALAVSLLHTGPRGLQGPGGPQGRPGDPGRSAQTARFGICWSYSTQTSSDGLTTWVTSVSVSPAQVTSGVYACPMGEQFVSIVPQATGTGG